MNTLALLWVKKNWSRIWRVAVGFAIVCLLLYSIHTINGWKRDSDALPQVKAQAAKDAADARTRYTQLQKSYDAVAKASKGYQHELKVLRDAAAAAGPAPVLRVCKPVHRVQRPANPSTTLTGSDSTPAAPGVLQEAVDFDTGPLFTSADHCDRLSAQVRGLLAAEDR